MNGLLINAGESSVKNIGDYIQSVAQEQFLPHVDRYVEREALNTLYTTEPINVIMNGWFMRHPENFPPSTSVNPLYVSIHIAPKIAETMLSPAVIEHFKKYEPIGCRDKGTQELLNAHGIKTYFSGCLTLTLGIDYKSEEKDDTVYFVDPYYEIGGERSGFIRSATIKSLWLLMKYFHKAIKLQKTFKSEFYSAFLRISPKLHNLVMAASFYDSYRHVFADDILLNARFIKHQVRQADFRDDDEKMEYARELIRQYARAKLVVTSRIHCALPCLGLETPVLFVSSQVLLGDGLRSVGRFGGIMDLFHVLQWNPRGVSSASKELNRLIGDDKLHRNQLDQLKNKDDYKPLRDSLIEKVTKWIKKYSK